MDIYQAQEMFKQLYPSEKVEFGFDNQCVAKMEIDFSDGKPMIYGFVEYRQLKVVIKDKVIYAPIMPHRISVTWSALKSHIASQGEVFIHESDLEALSRDEPSSEAYIARLKQIVDASGMTKEVIESMIPKAGESNAA